jgi:hypothetical protein
MRSIADSGTCGEASIQTSTRSVRCEGSAIDTAQIAAAAEAAIVTAPITTDAACTLQFAAALSAET